MKCKDNGRKANVSPEIKKYLKAVERKLRLPKNIRCSVLSDLLTEMYARVENGEDMKEILGEMGTPQQVADGINQEMDEFAYTKSPWRWACLALIVICSGILLMQGPARIMLILANSLLNKVAAIGGVDGPTQIYVTTTMSSQIPGMIMAGMLLVMGILGFYKLSHYQKKQG